MPYILAAVFFISLFGYYLGYGLFIRRHVSFFPVLFTACTVVFLYVFGMAGLLKAGFWLLLITGIILIPLAVIKRKNEIVPLLKKTLTDPSLFFMAAGTVWIWLITKGVSLSHADDFSHWYKICKIMHFENAYPTKPDTFYTTYVPGTATWIWFITSITGFAPDKCFFAHSLLNLAALNTFFSVGDRKAKEGRTLAGKLLLLLFTAVLSVTLCAMNVSTYSLLTDTIVALVPMAAVFYVLSDDTGDVRNGTALFTLLMCFGILIKISGIPFVLFACIYRNMQLKERNALNGYTSLKASAAKYLPAVIPFVFFFAYIIRAKIVFGSIDQSAQGISVKRFADMLSQKSGDQIRDILGRFLKEMFDIFGVMSMQVRLLWLVFAVLAVLFLITLKKKETDLRSLRRSTCALFVFFVVYSIFVLMTYLFSMKDHEANAEVLKCFYRYMGSVTIFVSGIISYILYGMFAKMDSRKGTAAAAALLAATAASGVFMFDIGYITGFSHYVQTEEFTTNAWDLLNEYAPERNVYNTDTYLLVYDYDDVKDCAPNKTRLAAYAYFRTNAVFAFTVDELREGGFSDESLEIIRGCDHLVTLGDFSDELDVIGSYVDVTNYTPGLTDLK